MARTQTTSALVTIALMALALRVSTTLGASIDIGEGMYLLNYTIVGADIRIQVTGNTTGYVGFGISPDGSMTGADLVIAGFDKETGAGYIGDYYGTGNSKPTKDSVQNVQLITASETATSTTVVFSRPLNNTADEFQDMSIENRNQSIIWSLGLDDTVSYHTNLRGSIKINLFDE